MKKRPPTKERSNMPKCISCKKADVSNENEICAACYVRDAYTIERTKDQNGTPFGGGGSIRTNLPVNDDEDKSSEE